MNQIITAIFKEGVLNPDVPLALPAPTRVRLTVELLDSSPETVQQAWEKFEQLCEEVSFDSGGIRMTRDQLHERR